MNVGISRAMEYNPRWIVISNDDMYKIDEVSILKGHLKIFTPINSIWCSQLKLIITL